ncbi:MAG: nucleoside 2-deoxyribosyltransferase [Methanothrix sp.]|uniref:nucleoside 2-deoxyribosyltransferase n=1 Tax=Methanothrix sp. TaxID=90426 RepID=UPI003BB55A04
MADMGCLHRIYLSGPLFSAGEIAWGRELSSFLRERLANAGVQVIWPYELSINQLVPEEIFGENLRALDRCDLMVAILDGPQVDDGTAWEIGRFFHQGKKVLGIRTDIRKAGESELSRVNLMIEFSCLSISSNIEELYSELERLLD